MSDNEILAEHFVEKLNNGELSGSCILDVREGFEWEYYHLDESIHMPMNTLPDKMGELPQEQAIYVICAHGIRSAAVCQYLERHGYDQAINVQGGMAEVSYRKDGFQYD